MERNLSPTEYSMLVTSMEYVMNNPHATTEAVPTHLLKFWAVPRFLEQPSCDKGSVQAMVFMFVLRFCHWGGEQGGDVVDSLRFSRLFFSFQIAIAATLHCRSIKLRAEPFPIFHLHEYKLPDLKNPEVLLSFYGTITGCRLGGM